MRLIRSWLLSTLAIWGASLLLPGSFYVDSLTTAALAALVLGILNFTVKPVLHILSLPITLLTFGLFSFVINGLIILLLANLMGGIEVSGFFGALIVAIIISFIHSFLNSLTKPKKR